MATLAECLNEAERVIRKPSFLKKQGLANEVPYRIFAYPAEKEHIVREWIKHMQARNLKAIDGFKLLVFDLYDIVIDLLEQEGFLQQCFRFEKEKGMDYLVNLIGELLQLDRDISYLVQYIDKRTPKDMDAVIFLTGIGKCYPFLRSHKVLNNLHQVLDNKPVVLFYPGSYTGVSLALFAEIDDGNYYRAFPLIDKECH